METIKNFREHEAVLAGQTIRLKANFAAATEIADKVADPFFIMRESALEIMFLEQQIPYEPKFAFTLKNVTAIIFIGMRAEKPDTKMADVQDLIFAAGLPAARDVAVEYLQLIAGPRPEEVAETTGDADAGK